MAALTAAPAAFSVGGNPARGTEGPRVRFGFLPARDGFPLEYRETFPGKTDPRLPAILQYQGSGPSTLVHPLLDVLHAPMTELGFTVFVVHKRGITRDPQDLKRDKIDEERYGRLTIRQFLQDAEDTLRFVTGREQFDETGVIVFGASEGTMVAAYLAESFPERVKAVFAVGSQIIEPGLIVEEQLIEGLAVRIMEEHDQNRDGVLDRQEAEKAQHAWSAFFVKPLGESIPVGWAGLTLADVVHLRAEHYAKTFADGDHQWWMRMVRVGLPFIRETYEIEPNESRYLRLKCPVYLFHGEQDTQALAKHVRRFQRTVGFLGRTNIHVTFEAGQPHGLDLNRDGRPFYQDFFRALGTFKDRVLSEE